MKSIGVRKNKTVINKLLAELERNGYNCAEKPDPLKYNLSGYWSLRIDNVNLIVFKISEEHIEIISYKTHYND